MNEFPKNDGDKFVGNMGDQMILYNGKFWLGEEIPKDEATKGKTE